MFFIRNDDPLIPPLLMGHQWPISTLNKLLSYVKVLVVVGHWRPTYSPLPQPTVLDTLYSIQSKVVKIGKHTTISISIDSLFVKLSVYELSELEHSPFSDTLFSKQGSERGSAWAACDPLVP